MKLHSMVTTTKTKTSTTTSICATERTRMHPPSTPATLVVLVKLLVVSLLAAEPLVLAFTPATAQRRTTIGRSSPSASSPTSSTVRATTTEQQDNKKKGDDTSSFVPLEPADVDDDDDEIFRKVEMFGRGAAKAKRGKRKGGLEASDMTSPTAAVPEKSALAAEDIFYEGPPAITETIAPTISILTVVGIIPAMASWARQAWVRYRITNRRIRVTSGIGGQDMAEIVYADIVELRTAKRLFGDGDLVAFLRDGAKFEMRNIPNFDATMEFIIKQVSPDVAAAYRAKGEVTRR